MNVWSFLPAGYCEQCCCEQSCASIRGLVFSSVGCVYLGVERISYGNSMFNFSEELPNWFP